MCMIKIGTNTHTVLNVNDSKEYFLKHFINMSATKDSRFVDAVSLHAHDAIGIPNQCRY